jgi:hypothetical protein
MKRRTDPDFDVEPWAEEMLNYCYFGGAAPPPSVNTDPLEPSHTHVPPKPPPKPKRRRQAKAAAAPSPSPAPKARAPRSRRQRPNPPPAPKPTIDELLEESLRRARVLQAQYAHYARHTPQVPAPFRVLGAPYPCTTDQLRARWRQVAFQHHPDRGGDLKQFIELRAAYEEAVAILEGRPLVFRWRA